MLSHVEKIVVCVSLRWLLILGQTVTIRSALNKRWHIVAFRLRTHPYPPLTLGGSKLLHCFLWSSSLHVCPASCSGQWVEMKTGLLPRSTHLLTGAGDMAWVALALAFPPLRNKKTGHLGWSWAHKTWQVALCTEHPDRFLRIATSIKGRTLGELGHVATLDLTLIPARFTLWTKL